MDDAAKKPAKAPRIDPIKEVRNKYTLSGWTVITPPKGGPVDLIASRMGKLHYVRVKPIERGDEPKYHGEAKNDFIQNAMSNTAIPVFATVHAARSPTAAKTVPVRITFENVNLATSVIVSRATKTTENLNIKV